MEPLILTPQLDETSFEILNGLRQQHFPRERNHLLAHVTLFHQLPGTEMDAIVRTLADISAAARAMPITFPTVRFLGRGVAIDVGCEPLLRLRAQLAETWQPWLTPQDRHGFRPHVTVQNKVTADTSKALFQRLSSSWMPIEGIVTGLRLWWYRGGPWFPAAEFKFTRPADR